MSLYNMLFGRNPYSDLLMGVLGLTEADCGRFRDCYPNPEGTEIIVHTRNGGGNRKEYFPTEITKHPNYLRDADDSFDGTYCDIVFSVPKGCEETVKTIAGQTNTTPPREKWQNLIKALEAEAIYWALAVWCLSLLNKRQK